MRIDVVFAPESVVDLPWEYPYYVYTAIIRTIQAAHPALGRWVHNEGFTFTYPDGRVRRFKGFCFSPIRSRRFQTFAWGLRLTPPLTLTVASPVESILEAFVRGLFHTEGIRVRDMWLPFVSAECQPTVPRVPTLKVRTASAVVVSTGIRKDGRLLKRYLAPAEPGFIERLTENLREKYAAIQGRPFPKDAVTIRLFGGYRSKLYRIPRPQAPVAIRGWLFQACLSGDPEVLAFVLDLGLGENTSMGCGFLEPYRLPFKEEASCHGPSPLT